VAALESVTYEGYGSSGVAVLVEALTDNRNRTGAEIRNIFNRHGGSLGEPGSVAWNFEKRGVIVVDGTRYSEEDLMAAIDAGADDVTAQDDLLEVLTNPSDLSAVRSALDQAGVEHESAEVTQRANNLVPVDESQAPQLMRLLEALEDQSDVSSVYANFDVDASVLERVL
jgi:YebC/PmpR family DNA-binding regulatory protein